MFTVDPGGYSLKVMSNRWTVRPRRRGALNLVVVPLTLLLVLSTSVPLSGQETEQEPELYKQARRELANGDTLAALAHLRQLTEEEPKYAPGWGLLGFVLTDMASGVMTDFHGRLEADEALRKAWSLDPKNPSYMMALGALMRKQSMYFDARRVLNRAKQYMQENPEEIAPAERAYLWYELGLHMEDVYLDTRHLVFIPDIPVYTPECAGLGAFCLNFTRPAQFNEYFRHAADLSEEGDDDYADMIDAFQRALEADPKHGGAFRRLAIHLVEKGQLDEVIQLSQSFVEQAPENPWGYMTLGLAYYRTGRDSLAQVNFDLGIARAGPDIAEHYLDVSYVLRDDPAEQYRGANAEARRWVEDLLWRKSDPLYLTPGNEVRVAHLGRVTFADLWFEDPSEGRWGADSEMGQIYVRYGAPERIWKIRRDASREQVNMAADDIDAGSRAEGGGRWIFWNYGWDFPNFIFQKQLRYRHASHVITSFSKSMEEEARKVEPAVYSTNFELIDFPVQIARFRGATDTIVEVDIYSEIPADGLIESPDTVDVGLFLFAGLEYAEVFQRKLKTPLEPEPKALTFSLPVQGGVYTYSLEAQATDEKAAVGRGEIDASPFRDGTLALSDLVLADAVVPKLETPLDRRGFALNVNRRRVFDRDLPVAVYWEVYGLATDAEGFANYQVRLSVTDAEGKGVLARVAQAFGFGEDDQVELSYERVVQWNGQRVPEYISLELVDSEPGEYRVSIEVQDYNTGRKVTTERTFQLVIVD